jgi:aryl-alcohol dehydrogenase-like predicted oxidoreductase
MDKTFIPSLRKYIGKIGLGCVTFGREIDLPSSFSIMDYALEKEITFFDTAAVYGGGASEKIIGQWFAERGKAAAHITISTKLLPPFESITIAAAVEQSLMRLHRDRIDILFLHSWHPSVEDNHVLIELNKLLTSGKIGALGASNFNTGQLKALLQQQINNDLTPVAFIQNNQNFAVSDVDDELRELCRDFNVHIITYSPLGAGFLTGKYRHAVSPDARFEIIPGHKDIYFNDHAWKRLDKLLKVAEETGKPVASLALSWAFRQPQVSSVLIGCRSTRHIDQALAAMQEEDAGLLGLLAAE